MPAAATRQPVTSHPNPASTGRHVRARPSVTPATPAAAHSSTADQPVNPSRSEPNGSKSGPPDTVHTSRSPPYSRAHSTTAGTSRSLRSVEVVMA
jgi:hypothetical protein